MVCGWGNYGIIIDGSVAEWLKAHDSKSCGRVNRLEGSNPFASATTNAILAFFRARSINNSTSHEENTNLAPVDDMNMTPFSGGLLASFRRDILRE